ncbi:MAG: Mu transposase C-terminal domain-containing protein, partial [Desulfobulbaceae bacterium]|nr:Mu transposase C-terminal domain-containing protein [Desulfobulbaceae bacterium]
MARNASRYLYITNPDAWKNQHMFAVGDASEQVIRLNQLWEFDSTPADVMLVDGRYNIIGVIDVFSRRLKLQVSKTSKATAVAALIRRAIIDWGVPEIAKTDNGADYVSNHIVQVFEGLEIEQQLCPPFTPEAKPHIERSFRTFSHGITTLLPGFIGHNVADRKAIEARRSFADRLMKRGDTVELTMTAEELQTLCNRWTEAMYHHNQHHGLNNQTPAQVARNYRGTERRISDERALDILLAEAPRGDGKRTVSKDGIKVENITYLSEQFDSLAGEQVRVKLDATDLGTIYLFDEDWNFLCIAHDPLRKGLNRAEEAAKLKNRQNKLMREGRKELTKLVRQQALDDIHNEILEHRERQIANIIELPKASEPYHTPALEEAGKAARAIIADQREERAMDELTADIIIEAEPEPAPVKRQAQKVVPIFSSAGDQYNYIKTRERTGPLTEREAQWLAEFYGTRSGRMYLELEGDLREKLGLPESRLAEA